MKRSSFFEKTLILIISNVFTGTLMFGFSIVLSREIGPGGMGLYQLVMPIYIMFLCITGGGITVSISKLSAQEKAKGNYTQLYKTIKAICIFEAVWSILVTIILVFASFYFANNILNDKRTLYSILAFCPAIIIVSISSVFKGAYYGIQRVIEPAIIDIVEKLVRLAILFLIFQFVGHTNIEFSAAIAVLSLSFGELSSLILFYFSFKNFALRNPGHGPSDNSFQLILNVLKLSVPLAINGILATVFTTVITILIPKRLQTSGMGYDEALALFGKLQGMALTIIFYPTIIIGSLNVLLIPSISEAVTFKKDGIINHRINTALRVAGLTAFSSTAIILSIPTNLGLFFFNDKTIGELLKVLGPGLPLVYFEITTFAILNGLGKQTNILINSTIISIFDLITLYIFLGIPSINIMGYGINFILSAIIGIFANIIIIKKTIKYKFDFYNTLLLPMLCAIISFIFTKTFFMYINSTPIIILFSYIIFSVFYFPTYNFSKKRSHKNSV